MGTQQHVLSSAYDYARLPRRQGINEGEPTAIYGSVDDTSRWGIASNMGDESGHDLYTGDLYVRTPLAAPRVYRVLVVNWVQWRRCIPVAIRGWGGRQHCLCSTTLTPNT